MKTIPRHKLALLILSLGLGACAATAPQDTQERFKQQLSTSHPHLVLDSTEKDAAINHLLQEPLTPEAAVQLMLLNSPRIHIVMAQLDIADAQRAQAELLSNPHFAVGALRPEGGGRWQLDFGLSQSLLDVFTRSLRRELAETALLNTRLALHLAIQTHIAELSTTYFDAVSARQILALREQQRDASAAGAALAQSMKRAGNLPESKYLQYQLNAQEGQRHYQHSRLAAESARLELLYQLGLKPDTATTLPTRLQPLPTEEFAADELVTTANTHRLDLQLIQQQQQQLTQQRPIIRRSRWADVSAGIKVEREFDSAINAGPEIEVGLPLFDNGKQKLAALDAQLTATQAQHADLQLKIERDIALALYQLHHAQTLATQSRAAQQTAKQRLAELQREVNFMLGSPFDLLQFKQQEIALGIEHAKALTDYWQARAALELAVGKHLPIAPQILEQQPSEASPDIDHSRHHHGGHHHD